MGVGMVDRNKDGRGCLELHVGLVNSGRKPSDAGKSGIVALPVAEGC